MSSVEAGDMTKKEFDQSVRELIDQFLRSGAEVSDIEDVLEYHRDGVEYYHDDLQRIARLQRQKSIDVQEDSVTKAE